jgi:hypothetical protein
MSLSRCCRLLARRVRIGNVKAESGKWKVKNCATFHARRVCVAFRDLFCLLDLVVVDGGRCDVLSSSAALLFFPVNGCFFFFSFSFPLLFSLAL